MPKRPLNPRQRFFFAQNFEQMIQARAVGIAGDGEAKAANDFILEKIATQLGHSQRNAGHWQKAIQWFQMAQKVSRTPEALQERIDEIKTEMAVQTNAPAAQPH